MVRNFILNDTCGYIVGLVGSPVPSQNALCSTLRGTLRAIGCCTASKPVQLPRCIPHVALRPLLPSLSTAFFMKHTQLLLHPSIHPSFHPSTHPSIHPSINPCTHSSTHRHLYTAAWCTLCYGWRVGIVHTKCITASAVTATAAPDCDLKLV